MGMSAEAPDVSAAALLRSSPLHACTLQGFRSLRSPTPPESNPGGVHTAGTMTWTRSYLDMTLVKVIVRRRQEPRRSQNHPTDPENRPFYASASYFT